MDRDGGTVPEMIGQDKVQPTMNGDALR